MDVIRYPANHGWIEVIVGSMFSGKSEELIRRLRRAEIARQKVQIFKPSVDVRYDANHVVSHSDMRIPSVAVSSSRRLLELVGPDTEVVGIDEGQFFDAELPLVVNEIANRGKRVIVAGLDQDYLGKPFEPMPQLLAIAEYITKTLAICMVCGNPANPHAAARGERRSRAGRRAGHV
jgi:thymidine kinase